MKRLNQFSVMNKSEKNFEDSVLKSTDGKTIHPRTQHQKLSKTIDLHPSIEPAPIFLPRVQKQTLRKNELEMKKENQEVNPIQNHDQNTFESRQSEHKTRQEKEIEFENYDPNVRQISSEKLYQNRFKPIQNEKEMILLKQKEIAKELKPEEKNPNPVQTLSSPTYQEPLILPTFRDNNHDFPAISHKTLSDLLLGKIPHKFDYVLIIDCRYTYEYDGGHIVSAHNWNDPIEILDNLFCKRTYPNSCVILHCEFSQARAPKLFEFLRNIDRKLSQTTRKPLKYPQMYVLSGGYRRFFTSDPKNQELCEPRNYREMKDKNYSFQKKANYRLAAERMKLKQKLPREITLDNLRNFCNSNKKPFLSRSYSQPNFTPNFSFNSISGNHHSKRTRQYSSLSLTPDNTPNGEEFFIGKRTKSFENYDWDLSTGTCSPIHSQIPRTPDQLQSLPEVDSIKIHIDEFNTLKFLEESCDCDSCPLCQSKFPKFSDEKKTTKKRRT
eukprot:Anaeramoba_ignava/a611369_29.p1 GENE.a611369_29~~a611369_29.p1  ORF type:complete len:496 (-),score=135.09 a611369_29:157-1644(-)